MSDSGTGGGTGEEPKNKSRKLKGTRIELLTEFMKYLKKKRAAFYKETGKTISEATMILAGHSKEQLDAYLEREKLAIKPWQKE
jgi:hypothetical protein